jgi:hypothetical protein
MKGDDAVPAEPRFEITTSLTLIGPPGPGIVTGGSVGSGGSLAGSVSTTTFTPGVPIIPGRPGGSGAGAGPPVKVRDVSGLAVLPSGMELSNSGAPPVPVINIRSEAALADPTCTVKAAKGLRVQKRTNSRARIANSFGCVSTKRLRAHVDKLLDLEKVWPQFREPHRGI